MFSEQPFIPRSLIIDYLHNAFQVRKTLHQVLLRRLLSMADQEFSRFMLLPPEIREEVYRYLLPNEDDICLGPGRKLIERYDGYSEYEYCPEMVSLRQDGAKCYTSILAVNSQINCETSRILYDRTYTITISSDKVTFLTREYENDEWFNGLEYSSTWKDFPTTFPFHRINALRILVETPLTLSLRWRLPMEEDDWNGFYERFNSRMRMLGALTNVKSGMKKLIIDTSKSCHLLPSQDVRQLLVLRGHVRNIQDFEIRLPIGGKDSLETIQLAVECGRKILSIVNSFLGTNNDTRCLPILEGRINELEAFVVAEHLVLGDGTNKETGQPCTQWRTDWTRSRIDLPCV